MLKNILKNQKLVIVIVMLMVFMTTGAKCQSLPPNTQAGPPKPITLEYWKVYEESSNVSDLISDYQKIHPYVTVNYRNFTPQEYETEILRALAQDRGPDIISLHNTWLRKYQDLLSPLPSQVTLQYQISRGTIQKETFTESRKQNTLTIKDLRALFPDVVYNNEVINNQIYGLPLSIDTLVLYYNRDLLNNAGLAQPPKTWEQFSDQVIKLTKLDIKGNVLQAGAALGTAANTERFFDILGLIMMQNNTPMTNEQGTPTFNQTPQGYTRTVSPAAEALNFYNSFASPGNQVYTWNDQMPNSLTAFMTGKTAFFFGYAYQLSIIKAQAPKLNFAISPVPQISEQPTNYANYWVETVTKKSQHINEAWDFITYITTNAETNKKFLDASHLPCALRNLIQAQADDIELSPFGSQLLTAKSWYKGKDAQKTEDIFKDMINQNLQSILTPEEIINRAVSKVNQTL
ncbi:MAG: extracellular solute-binding protein [Candidatus Parcubacteria bacterium]|nr:extracellular solute-binding protein [Candidatus Parcubacteria bacterium]